MKIRTLLHKGILLTMCTSVMLSACGKKSGGEQSDDVFSPTEQVMEAGKFDNSVQIGDTFFVFPAPIAVLTHIGAETKDDIDEKIAPGAEQSVDMKYNDIEFTVVVKNSMDFDSRIEDCNVYSITFNRGKKKTDESPVVFPQGLTMNSSYEEVSAKWGNEDIDAPKDDNVLTYRHYIYFDWDKNKFVSSDGSSVNVVFSDDKTSIQSLEMKFSDYISAEKDISLKGENGTLDMRVPGIMDQKGYMGIENEDKSYTYGFYSDKLSFTKAERSDFDAKFSDKEEFSTDSGHYTVIDGEEDISVDGPSGKLYGKKVDLVVYDTLVKCYYSVTADMISNDGSEITDNDYNELRMKTISIIESGIVNIG